MTASMLWWMGALLASSALTVLAIGYASRRRMLDLPGQRRSHVVATPRGGGIAPVLVMLTGGGWLVLEQPGAVGSIGPCLLGLALVAGIGWVDDHRPLPALPRLAVHVLAALIAALALCGGSGAGIAGVAIATIAVTSLVNIWNFMDGIDGIAASQAVLVIAAILAGMWLDGTWLAFAWLGLAALLGFLPFNLPRARIFLGDVGSGALGYVVAILLLRSIMAGRLPWPLAILPASAFIVDAGLTLGKRVLQCKRWWRPHREHLYQWLVRRGRSHGWIDVCYAAWTLAAGSLTVAASRSGTSVALALSLAALGLGVLCWLGFRKRIWMTVRPKQ